MVLYKYSYNIVSSKQKNRSLRTVVECRATTKTNLENVIEKRNKKKILKEQNREKKVWKRQVELTAGDVVMYKLHSIEYFTMCSYLSWENLCRNGRRKKIYSIKYLENPKVGHKNFKCV